MKIFLSRQLFVALLLLNCLSTLAITPNEYVKCLRVIDDKLLAESSNVGRKQLSLADIEQVLQQNVIANKIYTVVVSKDKIHSGENLESLTNEVNTVSGTIRFNIDGVADIAGVSNGASDSNVAETIKRAIEETVPDIKTRIATTELSNLHPRMRSQALARVEQKFLDNSDKFIFINETKPATLAINELMPGNTYTVLTTDDGKIVIGKNILGFGFEPKFGGPASHLTLLNTVKSAGVKISKDAHWSDGAGVIRFNVDGTIDISGYSHRTISTEAASIIEQSLRDIIPDANIRRTGNLIETLPTIVDDVVSVKSRQSIELAKLEQDLINVNDKIVFIDGTVQKNITAGELAPGNSYTLMMSGDRIVIGKNILGDNNIVGGPRSHMTLYETLKKLGLEVDAINWDKSAGAIRFNVDGTIDISGYNSTRRSEIVSANIEKKIKKILPDVKTRTTKDPLSEFSEISEIVDKRTVELIQVEDAFRKAKAKDNLIFIDGPAQTSIAKGELKPGNTYTIMTVNDKLVIGKNIPGEEGIIGGPKSHVTLYETLNNLGYKLGFYDWQATGGTLRFNYDGTIDISGFNTEMKSGQGARRISQYVKDIMPEAKIRLTGDTIQSLPPLQ